MTVLVPMIVEQDEDGWWWAHAQLGPNVGANGQGRTKPERSPTWARKFLPLSSPS
jgi:hypothetical protein